MNYNYSNNHMSSCYPPVNPCPSNDNAYLIGNSVSFKVGDESEIKADLIVQYRETVRVWGQIKDCNGNCVPYAYVKLVRPTANGYEGIAHTVTDCRGFYQFDICPCTDGCDFTIFVGKAATGPEIQVSAAIPGPNSGANCTPCNNGSMPPCPPGCNPCK